MKIWKKFMLLLVLSIVSCVKQPNEKSVVGIVPYHGIEAKKVARLKAAIEQYYGVRVKVMPQIQLPEKAYINIKSPRYRADSLISIQRDNITEDVDYVLGLTVKDISTTKKVNGQIRKPEWKYNDFGIMGLAYCPGNSAIVSDFRLRHPDKQVHFGRFKKVVIHELGHNFGLPHCPNKQCVMTDAVESIRTVDNAKPALYKKCKEKPDI